MILREQAGGVPVSSLGVLLSCPVGHREGGPLLIGEIPENSKRARGEDRALLLILPFLVSVSFLLIADLDSPRRGIIHVHPDNLLRVSGSCR